MPTPKRILPIIVIAQFCCTSLWFASNGVINNIITEFRLNDSALGYLTSAIQFGFIIGTLTFAILSISDRFSPSKVFFASAILGAVFNLGIIWQGNSLITLSGFRFLTGFFLAGIYPVGMKIAADYFEKGLGKSLSFLVGALVLGTALPHLLNQFTNDVAWQLVIKSTSILAIIGGLLILLLVPDGPFRKTSKTIDLKSFLSVFKVKKFRLAAFSYFGHMWELYTFWAFVPIILKHYNSEYQSHLNVSLLAFFIIGIGSIACIIGGLLSKKFTPQKIVLIALSLSGLCCLISPFIMLSPSSSILLIFLLFWGMVVIMDSPLLSTLVAQHAPADKRGTALTVVNCIGYTITIISIQLITKLIESIATNTYLILAIGPVLGVISLLKYKPTYK